MKTVLIVAGLFLGAIFFCLYANNNKPITLQLQACVDIRNYAPKNEALAKTLESKGRHKEATALREETSKLSDDCK